MKKVYCDDGKLIYSNRARTRMDAIRKRLDLRSAANFLHTKEEML